MDFLIGVLLFVLFLNALFLILLILVQLPKKEAGVGMAFGGGAGEALFQGGAANALSKMTTRGTVVFLTLTLVVSVLVSAKAGKDSGNNIKGLLDEDDSTNAVTSVDTNSLSTNILQSTNVLVAPDGISTNQPVEIKLPIPGSSNNSTNESNTVSTNSTSNASTNTTSNVSTNAPSGSPEVDNQ